MFKMEIALDTQKIENEGVYEPSEITRQLDKLFAKMNIQKLGEGLYTGGDFAGYGSAILFLKKQPWFMSYVDKWLWYNSDGSDREEDFTVEDVAAHYKNQATHRA